MGLEQIPHRCIASDGWWQALNQKLRYCSTTIESSSHRYMPMLSEIEKKPLWVKQFSLIKLEHIF